MAAQILQKPTPELVIAFSDRIQPLLDQFLAKGLITDEVYQRILETNSSSLDKARSMLNAIKDVIETDVSCFIMLLSILKEIFTSDNKLVLHLQDEYQKCASQPPPSKCPKLRRVSSDPTIRQSASAEHLVDNLEFTPASRRFRVLPEVRVIQVFTPKLVSTLLSIVNNISEQCLSKGIIPESLHSKLLEIEGSDIKVRKLLQAVRSSIKFDNRCYKIFVSVLKEVVPSAIRDKLLSEIKIEYKNLSKAGVDPECPNIASASDHLLQEFDLEEGRASSNFKVVVDEFKESVKNHTRACIEKEMLEGELAKNNEEKKELEKELAMAKAGGKDGEHIRQLQERLDVCESEIKGIKESIAEKDKMIETASILKWEILICIFF